MTDLASRLSSRSTRRIILYLKNLIKNNTLMPKKANRLEELADPPGQSRLIASLFLIFGALMLVGGILPIALGIGVVRFDRRLTARTRHPA